jgi:hypothetical protein
MIDIGILPIRIMSVFFIILGVKIIGDSSFKRRAKA